MVTRAMLALALLSAACGEAPQGAQAKAGQSETGPAPGASELPASAGTPSAAQLDEALAFADHPFVLGRWMVPEAHRPLMRCVQIGSGTRTNLETGEVTRATKVWNRCSFPIRFTGTVGKKDESGTICVPELRPTGVLLPDDGFDLPQVMGGNCFDDVEELAVDTGGAGG